MIFDWLSVVFGKKVPVELKRTCAHAAKVCLCVSLSFYLGLCAPLCVLLMRGVAGGWSKAWISSQQAPWRYIHTYNMQRSVRGCWWLNRMALPATPGRRGLRQHVARPRQPMPCYCIAHIEQEVPPRPPSILHPPLQIYDRPGREFLFSVVGSVLIT
jgi:hypothetical protein